MKLYSLQTNEEIGVGQIVEYLPARTDKYILWVKVLTIDTEKHLVQLRSTFAGEGWYPPAEIGARIGNKKVNSLAGGRRAVEAYSAEAARDMSGARAGVRSVPVEELLGDEVDRVTITKASAVGKSEMPLPNVHTLHVTGPECDTILAGLRLLQYMLGRGRIDFAIENIRTDNDAHLGLSVDEIDALCERIN